MKKSNLWAQIAALSALILVLGGLPFLKGAFYLGKHEGDTLQMADLVLRMAEGQWPHLDFMTPIGILAMAPIALFCHFGVGLGHAVFLAQLLVAVLLAGPALYVARSRFDGWAGWIFPGFVAVLCLALVHGQTEPSVSISMHYNRWAWALVYIAVPLVMLEPKGRSRPTLDGVLLGLILAALALTKVTYFISVAPAILVGLLARRWWSRLCWTAVAGLAVALLMTALAGPGYWLAYVNDLRAVAGSAVRPQPGEGFIAIAAGPAFMGGSLALFLGIVFLRQSGRMVEGLMLLMLAPGFLYIVFQNFGNDPQWLMLVGLLLWTLRPAEGVESERGWDLHRLVGIAALVALTFGFPSAMNLAYSPLRHMGADEDKTMPLLSARPGDADIRAKASRIYGVLESRSDDGPDSPFAAYAKYAEKREPAILNGEELPYCEGQQGFIAWFETATKELQQSGYGQKPIFVADLFSALWLFGDNPPLKGGAPWYYAGLSGLENADYVLVPLCPQSLQVRSVILKELREGGYTLTEVSRTPLYILIEAKRAS